MKSNRSVPEADVIPVLAYPDVDPASWGATEVHLDA